MTDSRLLADIRTAEGCKLTAYKDGEGFWTIGFGHRLDQSIDWTGHTITMAVAVTLLGQDIDDAATNVQKLPEWASLDTPCRQNALIECVFNLGVGHWTSEFPRTRNALQQKLWQSAAANLLLSPEWIAEVGRSRVARLASYFQNGQYPAVSTAPTGSP
jgi:GH24 family phage-related lysozyme (muramidase)